MKRATQQPAKRKPGARTAKPKSSSTRKPPATPAKAAAKRATKSMGPSKKVTTLAKKPTTAAKKATPRREYGVPIDGFFKRQPANLRAILVELRKLVEAAAPEATSSIKWGMPFFTVNDTMMCALGSHKKHVNLILAGPPGTYADPEGQLSGDGKTGRHLKLTTVDELPRDAVRGWLRTAVELARKS